MELNLQLDGFTTAYVYVWFFFAYSVGGVIVETIYCWAIEHKGVIESRAGILYLPFNPLYGFGGVAVTAVLVNFAANPLMVFLIGLVICTTLEYFASLVMEKVFKTVFWDYSDKPLNLHGRICLQFAIYWGLLSLFLLYVLDTTNLFLIAAINPTFGLPFVIVLGVLTIFCTLLTLGAYVRFEQRNRYLTAKKNGDPAVLPHSWWTRVVDLLVPDDVFINTFPRMSVSTEYQDLTGNHRKLLVWIPRIGKANQRVRAMGERERALQHTEREAREAKVA